ELHRRRHLRRPHAPDPPPHLPGQHRLRAVAAPRRGRGDRAERPARCDTLETMFNWITAGEYHGQALVGLLNGVPPGVRVTTSEISSSLARRRLGFGVGARVELDKLVGRL